MEQTIDEIAEDYQATIDTCRYEYGDEYGYHLGRVGYEDYKDLGGGVLEGSHVPSRVAGADESALVAPRTTKAPENRGPVDW